MQFGNIFLLHGKGGSPDGSAKQLEEELRRYYPARTFGTLFQRPRLLHANPAVLAEESLAEFAARKIPRDAALVGISLGGLIAARLQESGREDLHVICISSPTWADGVRLERRMANRVAFYSSHDEVIAGRIAGWPQLAQAFDLPWLSHDTDAHKRELARLVFAYLDGDNLPRAVQELEAALRRSRSGESPEK